MGNVCQNAVWDKAPGLHVLYVCKRMYMSNVTDDVYMFVVIFTNGYIVGTIIVTTYMYVSCRCRV